jgi:hypothetical protein
VHIKLDVEWGTDMAEPDKGWMKQYLIPRRTTLVLPDGRSFTSSEPEKVKQTYNTTQYDVRFPRGPNGIPDLTPSGSVQIRNIAVSFRFDLSKMVYHGKLEY